MLLEWKSVLTNHYHIFSLSTEESPELRSMLTNPHLRQIITDLAHSGTDVVDRKLEAALREPIFTEFSDKCIEIVDDEESIDT